MGLGSEGEILLECAHEGLVLARAEHAVDGECGQLGIVDGDLQGAVPVHLGDGFGSVESSKKRRPSRQPVTFAMSTAWIRSPPLSGRAWGGVDSGVGLFRAGSSNTTVPG